MFRSLELGSESDFELANTTNSTGIDYVDIRRFSTSVAFGMHLATVSGVNR